MAQFGATQLLLIGVAAVIALPLVSKAQPPAFTTVSVRPFDDGGQTALRDARAAWGAGDAARAQQLLRQARADAAQRGDAATEVAAMNSSAAIHAFNQNFAAAESARLEALAVARARGMAGDEVKQLSGLAALKVRTGDMARACALLLEAARAADRAPTLKPAVQSGLRAAACVPSDTAG